MEKRVNIHNYLHPYIVQVENHLNIAYRQYYELKKYALKLRESWLIDLTDMKAKVNGGNQYSIYKILMNWEKQRRARRRLCQEMGKAKTGLTHVEVNTTTVKEERN